MLGSTEAPAQVQDIYKIDQSRFQSHVEYHEVKLSPGQEMVLGDLTGPGKVTYFYYTDSSSQGGVNYQGLVLKVFWDDAKEPSVRVPLWNFFGAFGRKTIDYQSLLMQINHYCYMSYLPMPFSKRARFVLLNDGTETYSPAVAWASTTKGIRSSNMKPAVCMSRGLAQIPPMTPYILCYKLLVGGNTSATSWK